MDLDSDIVCSWKPVSDWFDLILHRLRPVRGIGPFFARPGITLMEKGSVQHRAQIDESPIMASHTDHCLGCGCDSHGDQSIEGRLLCCAILSWRD